MFFRKRQKTVQFKCVLPQSSKRKRNRRCRNERISLCTLQKGSLTVEAALVLPFFLLILLAFFSFSGRYAQALKLQTEAAAEARTVGVLQGAAGFKNSGRIVIRKSAEAENLFEIPFIMEKRVSERAVCRAWVGFRGLGEEESKVYITPEGNVYHLYADCTHLDLSIRQVPFQYAVKAENEYGERYRECEICQEKFSGLVYITDEGNCYHSEKTCGGLKRTVLCVPISEVFGRSCCQRCIQREGES